MTVLRTADADLFPRAGAGSVRWKSYPRNDPEEIDPPYKRGLLSAIPSLTPELSISSPSK
jgi:hypothetical protein